MKKDEIYFGEVGLTSTSANHLANKAKEYVANLENELSNVSFVTDKMSLLDSDKERVLKVGLSDSAIDMFDFKLSHIAQAKSLCAWLREAIKAKETLDREVSRTSLENWCELTGTQEVEYPASYAQITDDDYLATLSVKDRNRYFELETFCAVYGKFIHVDGAYYKARKDMNNKIQNPVEVRGEGHDAIIVEHTTSVTPAKVEDVFFKLNEKHRNYQAELNAIKHTMSQWVFNKNAELTEERNKVFEQYKLASTEQTNAYNTWKTKERKRISGLKIVIPNALQGIYEEVNKL